MRYPIAPRSHNHVRIERPLRGGPRRGAMMVGVVLLLPVLFILAALTIHVAHVQLVRTELQVATDAASRAAARTFARTGDRSRALAAAQAVAMRNTVGGEPAVVEADRLEFGIATRAADDGRYAFTVSENASAVRLTTRGAAGKTGGVGKPIFPIFGATSEVRPVCSVLSTQADVDAAVVVDPQRLDEPSLQGLASLLNSRNPSLQIHFPQASPAEDPAERESGAVDRPAIADAIQAGLDVLADPNRSRRWAEKIIIVIGDHDGTENSKPAAAAIAAAEQGVSVFTISLTGDADLPPLPAIARQGAGRHYRAVDAAEVGDAVDDILRRFPTILLSH